MSNVFETLMEYKSQGLSAVLVTVTEVKGEGPVEVGKKMVVSEHGDAVGTVGGGALEYQAREYCKKVVNERKSTMKKYLLNEGSVLEDTETLPMVCGGVVTLFYEYVGFQQYIYIFGGGHVGQALTNVLNTLNYHITMIDERKDVYDKFTGANEKHHAKFTDFIEQKSIKEGSFVVICTPSHKHDYNVVNKILELDLSPSYMGMLCSPKKLKEYLDQTRKMFDREINLNNFYSPIGLNLGGGSPEEIAISITAEIMAVANDKPNHSHMRETENSVNNYYWTD